MNRVLQSLAMRCAPLVEIVSKRPRTGAIVCGVAAALFAMGYLSEKENSLIDRSSLVTTIVSSCDIEKGRAIAKNCITAKKIPKMYLEPGATFDPSNAAGMVAISRIPRGAQITDSNSKPSSASGRMSAAILPGMRAVNVRLDDSLSTPDLIVPGDYVDVIAAIDIVENGKAGRTTVTVVENAKVMAVNGDMRDDAGAMSSMGARGQRENSSPMFAGAYSTKSFVSLALTPEDASKVMLARSAGQLAVAVRAAGDENSRGKQTLTTISSITGRPGDVFSPRRDFKEYKGK